MNPAGADVQICETLRPGSTRSLISFGKPLRWLSFSPDCRYAFVSVTDSDECVIIDATTYKEVALPRERFGDRREVPRLFAIPEGDKYE